MRRAAPLEDVERLLYALQPQRAADAAAALVEVKQVAARLLEALQLLDDAQRQATAQEKTTRGAALRDVRILLPRAQALLQALLLEPLAQAPRYLSELWVQQEALSAGLRHQRLSTELVREELRRIDRVLNVGMPPRLQEELVKMLPEITESPEGVKVGVKSDEERSMKIWWPRCCRSSRLNVTRSAGSLRSYLMSSRSSMQRHSCKSETWSE